jgi:hypothetical protein
MSSQNDTFPYTPLVTSQIRLLVLLPGSKRQPISCNLATVMLHAPENEEVPVYHALSYQWGPPHPTTKIYVNNAPFHVRNNLFEALRELRYEYFPRCLWIDAICINQTDNTERGTQVSIMSDIFRSATKVLVWLGEASHNSDMAFEILASVRGHLGLIHKMARSWQAAGVDVAQFTNNQVEMALLSICTRPYWSRLWIIQEILSSSSVDILCGSKVLGWEEFWTGLQCIANINIPSAGGVGPCVSKPAYLIARKAFCHSKRYTIEELFVLCLECNSQCEDIRDRVFGLLSLSWDLKIMPDYSKSVQELYLDVIQAHCSATHSSSGRPDLPPLYWNHLISDCELIATTRRLLRDPLYSPEKDGLPAIRSAIQIPLSQQIKETFVEIRVYALSRIEAVGPIFCAPKLLNDRTSYYAHLPVDIQHDYIADPIPFSEREFYGVTVIGEAYSSTGAPHARFIRDKLQSRSMILQCDGHHRAFSSRNLAYGSDYGISTPEVQPGDILCHMHCFGFCVIRMLEDPNSFTLVSTAIANGHGNNLLVRKSGLGECTQHLEGEVLVVICRADCLENDHFKIVIDFETLLLLVR